MTQYEILMNKAQKCRDAALKSESKEMKAIWLKHADALEQKARDIDVKTAAYVWEKHLQNG